MLVGEALGAAATLPSFTADIDGSLDAHDCAVSYKQGGRTLASATMSRDLVSLQAEAAMESGKQQY